MHGQLCKNVGKSTGSCLILAETVVVGRAIIVDHLLVSEHFVSQGFSMVQIQEVEDNTEFVQQREREVTHIVRSIQDLNEIFKDVASMVVDQVRIHILAVDVT